LLIESLDQIDATLLQKLCNDKCPESQTLEFKRDLPSPSDKDKHEICKDVAALANTEGGDLVYGIDEKSAAAESISPITEELSDAAMRRITQVLDAGIEPRIQGIRIRHVDVPGGYCIILRVPSSFDGPHCIRVNHNRRFVMRNGTNVTDMSFDQLRGAFDRTATLAERARRFIADRLQLIADRQTPTPLLDGPQLVAHLVPVAGLAGRKSVDLRSIASTYAEFIGPDWGGGSRTFNFDGLLIHPGLEDGGYSAYNQIFRAGALESARQGGGTIDVSGSMKRVVWSNRMSRFFYDSIKKFLDSAKAWGFAGPAIINVAILNAKGYELEINGYFHGYRGATSDREHLIPSGAWIEDIDSVDTAAAVRPLLDTLWQAFSVERCLDFDDTTGAFSPRKR